MASILRRQLLDTTRGRIVAQLQSGGRTAEDLASALGLTSSAVRVHLIAMERDGVIRRAGQQPGATRPARIFELTPEVEQLLSQAYLPFLSHLVGTFVEELPPSQMTIYLRKVGQALAIDLSRGKRLAGRLGSRVAAASDLLNEQLGSLTHVEKNGQYVIRGAGCPLAALTGKHPAVCIAVEHLVQELVQAPVHECCDRTDRPRCCFEIGTLSRSGKSG